MGLVQTSVPFALGGKQCKLQHRDATGTRRSSYNSMAALVPAAGEAHCSIIDAFFYDLTHVHSAYRTFSRGESI
jgi:hypothetical protein